MNQPLRALRAGEGSFDAASIREFVRAKRDGRPLQLPSCHELASRIIQHLKASVWLPFDEDYVALGLGILTSFAQEIFSAVPLFLLFGPAGSGKTALGEEMARLGCNGRALGRTTIAGLMEATDRCRGLVSIDDLEEISPGKGRLAGEATNPYQQLIKQSYKKSSGTQTRIGEAGELKIRNIYGVKVLNNTKGVDAITETRVITIRTRCRSENEKRQMDAFGDNILQPDEIRDLRNKIHQWVFTNVTGIAMAYDSIMVESVARNEEIAAPLRTFAKLTGDTKITEQLESVFARRKSRPEVDGDKAFAAAMESIVARGFKQVTAYQVINEFRLKFGKDPHDYFQVKHDIPRLVKFVSGKLIRDGWVEPKPFRVWINHEITTRLRAYSLSEEKIQKCAPSPSPQEQAQPAKTAEAFCSGCRCCKYHGDCSLMEVRAKRQN